jgi:hypothetical protein
MFPNKWPDETRMFCSGGSGDEAQGCQPLRSAVVSQSIKSEEAVLATTPPQVTTSGLEGNTNR